MSKGNTYHLESLVPDFLHEVKPYIPAPPDSLLKEMFGCQDLYRLNNNENPFGPPPPAVRILEKYDFNESSVYPQGDSFLLRKALGEHYGMDPDCFICAVGSNSLISALIKSFCTKGDNIVTPDRTYAVYEWAASYIGCTPKLIPLKDYDIDFDTMLSAIDEKTKVVCLCNPNNPTGSYWPLEKVKTFIERVGPRKIVVVDEAYMEYVSEDFEHHSAVNLIEKYPNLLVMKTYSKIYGLAALRLGYLMGGPEITEIVRRTVICYSVNSLAILAAEAIVRGGEEVRLHIDKTRRAARESDTLIKECANRLSLECHGGGYGFTMVHLPISDTLAYRKLMSKGYMVRPMTGFRFPNWIRVSSSTPEVISGFCRALEQVLGQVE